MAAAISYYVLFSLFPLLLFAVGILGLFLQDSQFQRDVISLIQDNVPLDEQGDSGVADRVGEVAGVGSGALGVFGLVGMAWAGSNMFAVIRRSLNIAWDLHTARPFVRQKLVDFAMMVILGLLVLTSLAATAALRAAQQLSQDFPVAGSIVDSLGATLIVAQFLIPTAVSCAAFFLLYWLLPATHVRRREAVVGALVAAILFEAAKVGFAVYVEHFGNYNAVYGSIGAVVVFLFWVYISANILLMGAEVAAEHPRVLHGDYDAPPPQASVQAALWFARLRRSIRAFGRRLVVHDRRP